MKISVAFLFYFLLFLHNALAQFGDEHDVHLYDGLVTRSVDAADLDGDGDLDAMYITTPMHGGKIYWLENLGGGTFGAEKTIFNGVGSTAILKANDFDGDGDIDILISIPISGTIGWFMNDGSGNFSSLQNIISIPINSNVRYVIGDDDSDGDNDLIVAFADDDKISSFENLGGLVFGPEEVITAAVDYPIDLCLSDLDGDGDDDLLSASSDDNKIAWYENSLGVFGSQQILSLIAAQATTVAAADIDLDGDIDVVSGSAADAKIAWYENLGLATFSSQIFITTMFATPIVAVELFDLTGDNAPEVIVHSAYNTGAGNCRWLINTGTGTFGPIQGGGSPLGGVRSICPADIDFDGDCDILLANSGDGSVHYLENSGTADLLTYVTISKLMIGPKMLEVADLDSDGLKDIVAVSAAITDRVIWYKNLGADNFGDQQIISTDIDNPLSLELADFDNDGDLDILSTSLFDDKVAWYENDGNANFGPQALITNSIDMPWHSEIFDLENDGDFDIAVCSNSGNEVFYIENLGAGIFGTEVLLTSLVNSPEEIRSADLNNDGYMDLVTISVGDNKIAWYENLGGSGFGSQVIVSNSFLNPMALIIVDVDGDSDKDIITGDEGSIVIFRNDGSAIFTGPEIVTNLVLNNLEFAVGDINLDGDPDLVSYSSGTNAMSWYENMGNGTFGPQDVITGYPNLDGNIQVVDIDEDGDLDITYCSDLSNRKISWCENYSFHPSQVKGRLFIDMNQNFQHDSSDIGVNQFGVFSSPQSDFTFTSTSGNYFMNFSDVDGFYVIQPDSLPYWSIVTDSLSYTIEVDTSFIALDSLDFGFYPDTLINYLSPQLVGGFPRCNQIVNYWLSYANNGTTIPSGYIELVLDDDITYVSSAISPDSISGNSVYWSYDSLFYFSGGLINLQVQMPSFTSMGDTLQSQLNIFVLDTSGNVVYMNADSLNQILVCAYDPNDKTVEPAGISSFGYIAPETEFLEYVIRFQNTGNDTAINVVIQDMLDPSLDWSTFTPLASSHYVHIDGDQSGQVTFTFPNIMLPDSNVNEIGSHGFVKYKINLMPDLTSGTVINNTANIFFDFNPAVITNTTINTIFDCEGLAEDAIYPSIICEGENVAGLIPDYSTDTQYEWIISAMDTIIGNELLWMANTSGMFDLTLKMSNDFCSTDTSLQFTINPTYYQNPDTLSICFGESALIFGQPQSLENLYHDTLQTILGCDSVLSVFVKVNPAPLNLADTISICLGEDLLIFGQTQLNEGLYYDTLQTILGCDSVLSIFLKVNMPYYNSPDTISICSGESALIFGGMQYVEGLYYDTLQTIFGCDSVLSEFLDVLPLPLVEMDNVLDDTVCIYTSEISIFATPLGGTFSGSGITSNQFNPSLAGSGMHYLYYNYTDIDNCTATDSISIYVDVCLTISEINLYNIQIQPNPFTDHIIISADDNLDGNYAVSICNMLGEVVYMNEMSINSETSIYPADLTAGVYLISIVDISNQEIIFQGKIVAN